jgi:hypothetical protein
MSHADALRDMRTARESWEALCEEFLSRIKRIDLATPAHPDHPEMEPIWWLQMMDCAKYVRERAEK